MTAHCLCPELPTSTIPTGPVTCVCCGHPLELTCAGECGKVDESMAAAAPVRNAEVTRRKPRAAERKPRNYKSKPCLRCRETFQPTGARAILCEACVMLRAVGA